MDLNELNALALKDIMIKTVELNKMVLALKFINECEQAGGEHDPK